MSSISKLPCLENHWSSCLLSGLSFPTYLLLLVVYFPLFYWRCHQKKSVRRSSLGGGSGPPARGQPVTTVFKKRGLRYFFLAVVDVESNYLTHRAFQYTTLTSIEVRLNSTLFLSSYPLVRMYHIGMLCDDGLLCTAFESLGPSIIPFPAMAKSIRHVTETTSFASSYCSYGDKEYGNMVTIRVWNYGDKLYGIVVTANMGFGLVVTAIFDVTIIPYP